MKISNTMKIKQQDGSFEDVKISYIEPNYCTAEGYQTTVSGDYSHAEGEGTIAMGKGAHAEGFYELSDKATLVTFYKESQTQPIYRAELENENNIVVYTGDIIQIDSKYYSIIKNTTFNFKINGDLEIDNGTKGYYFQRAGAAGDYSHSEGYNSEARGDYSHAEGEGTIAFSVRQHAQGKYNIRDTKEKYAHIVGNGDDNDNRSNAHTLDWNGNAWFAGDIEDGKGNILDNAQKEADKAYALAEKKVSGISNSIITGSYVYDGSSTDKFSFEDENVRGKSFIICGTQDAGNPILRAYISENTISVDLSGEITNMRVNYICF